MANIFSVSVSNELRDFLDENKDLSPSKILQQQLMDIKNNRTAWEVQKKAYERRTAVLSEKLHNVLKWCEANHIVIPENVLE